MDNKYIGGPRRYRRETVTVVIYERHTWLSVAWNFGHLVDLDHVSERRQVSHQFRLRASGRGLHAQFTDKIVNLRGARSQGNNEQPRARHPFQNLHDVQLISAGAFRSAGNAVRPLLSCMAENGGHGRVGSRMYFNLKRQFGVVEDRHEQAAGRVLNHEVDLLDEDGGPVLGVIVVKQSTQE